MVCVDAADAGDEPGRRIARALATLHVASDEATGRQLIDEGVPEDRVMVTGNPDGDDAVCVRVADALAGLCPAVPLAPASQVTGSPNQMRSRDAWETT